MIAVRGYCSAVKGSDCDYIWPEDPGVHKSCFGPAIPLPMRFLKETYARMSGLFSWTLILNPTVRMAWIQC